MFKSMFALFVLALVAPMAFGAPAPGIIGGLGLGHGAILAAAPATISVQKSIVQHPTIIATPVVAAAPIGIGISHGAIALGHGGIGLGGLSLAGHGW